MNWRGLNFRLSDESRFNIFLRYQFQSARFGRFSKATIYILLHQQYIFPQRVSLWFFGKRFVLPNEAM